MVHYGTRVEIEEFTNLKMEVRIGREFYTLMSILDSMKYIWIQEILRYYMPLVIKEEDMYILMWEEALDQVCISQRMEEILGLKLTGVFPMLNLVELV